jgi:hypothetical protein
MTKNKENEPEMIKDSSVTLKELKEKVKVLEENGAGLKETVSSHEERIKALESKQA